MMHAELLSVYLASLGSNPLQASTVLQDRYVQVGGMWYLVQRDASRGEILLGPTPSDIQLLTAERHLGQLRFSRCEEPENHLAEKAEEEVRTVLAATQYSTTWKFVYCADSFKFRILPRIATC